MSRNILIVLILIGLITFAVVGRRCATATRGSAVGDAEAAGADATKEAGDGLPRTNALKAR